VASVVARARVDVGAQLQQGIKQLEITAVYRVHHRRDGVMNQRIIKVCGQLWICRDHPAQLIKVLIADRLGQALESV